MATAGSVSPTIAFYFPESFFLILTWWVNDFWLKTLSFTDISYCMGFFLILSYISKGNLQMKTWTWIHKLNSIFQQFHLYLQGFLNVYLCENLRVYTGYFDLNRAKITLSLNLCHFFSTFVRKVLHKCQVTTYYVSNSLYCIYLFFFSFVYVC